MSAEELEQEKSSNEQQIEYIKIEGSPFTIAKVGNEYHLLMGNWKINDETMYSEQEVLNYMESNKWNIVMKMAGCIVYDMVKPVIAAEAIKPLGVHVNKPE